MTTQHTKQELGTFKKVENIRDIWPTEDDNFTPWLAENISELGDALGLRLEEKEQEAPVGRFRLDVLARESGTDHNVTIENQFNQTDHDHLGKLLTYAAGYDAKVAIWIAERFREEHRAALDLLNNRTDKDTKFFGVRIEVWTIDNSRPAPRFDVVAAPNNWTKEVRKAGTPLAAKYMEFFEPLLDTLKDHPDFRKSTNPTYYSRSFPAYHSDSDLSYRISFFTQGGGKHRIELYIDRGDKALNEAVFNKLYEQKQDIETALGKSHTWDWEDTTRGTSCRISITRDGGIDDENKHDDIRKWMIDHLLKFKEVFDPRLAELAEQGILDRR